MNSIVYVVGSSYWLLSAFCKTVKELVKNFIKFLDIF
nr:MAG TPA: hypothetical protein [Caudoviricetes sp.]